MPNILTEFTEFQQYSREHGPSVHSLLDDTQSSDIWNLSQHSPSVVNSFAFIIIIVGYFERNVILSLFE